MKKLIMLMLIVAQVALASEGNEGGGGGNTRPTGRATAEYVRSSIIYAQKMTQQLVNGLDISMMTLSPVPDVADEYVAISELILKNGAKSAIAIGKKAKLVIQQAACKSPQGPSQASANPKTMTICFSVGEILKQKHNIYEIEAQMTALYMHELAHLVGLGNSKKEEAQATVFQETLVAELVRYDFEDLMNRNNQFRWMTSDSLNYFLSQNKGKSMCEVSDKRFENPVYVFIESYPPLANHDQMTREIVGLSPIDSVDHRKLAKMGYDCKDAGSVDSFIKYMMSLIPDYI